MPLAQLLEQLKEKVYLGDSVYASFDGFSVVLTTDNGLPSGPSNTIYLEPKVLGAFGDYRDALEKSIEGYITAQAAEKESVQDEEA